jgi:UDP-N-acetyl-D-mannosaminuronic acid dehydrogenase
VQQAVAEHLARHPNQGVADVTIGVLGLAFKPNVDDLRESPALQIAQTITRTHPGPVAIAEPHIDTLPNSLTRADLCTGTECIARADVVVLLVDHTDFMALTAAQLDNKPRVDTRGFWARPPRA